MRLAERNSSVTGNYERSSPEILDHFSGVEARRGGKREDAASASKVPVRHSTRLHAIRRAQVNSYATGTRMTGTAPLCALRESREKRNVRLSTSPPLRQRWPGSPTARNFKASLAKTKGCSNNKKKIRSKELSWPIKCGCWTR